MSKARVPTLVVASSHLLDALQPILHAAAKDDARPILASVLIERRKPRGKPPILRFVACDNYRIAWSDVENLPEPTEPRAVFSGAWPDQLVIAREAVDALVKDLAKLRMTVPVTFELAGPLALSVTVGDVRRSIRVVDGHYPKYEAIIPTAKPRHTVAVSGWLLAEVAKAFCTRPHSKRDSSATLILELPADPLQPIRVRTYQDSTHGEVLMPVRAAEMTIR